ncbi:DEAD/DEAH box helicase family protein [Patescibacteria group bacterium]|nr:DEAD/DEAH box helicase family protein [Patescibacteria group bacterium]
MQLKIYQENAIDDLLIKTKRLLGYSGSKKLVFKSPTGSGKTIMMAEFLKQLVDDRPARRSPCLAGRQVGVGREVRQSLGFIWAAPRQLHIQSKEKLENYFETNRALKCFYFEDLDDRKISENEILFFNWESINKKNAIYIRDNEQDFNLSKVLERTREEDRKIILIIDESWFAAGAKDAKEEQAATKLRKDINADLTIEVAATPILKDPDDMVSIDLEDVKKEGMIKKAIILNEEFDKFIKSGKIYTNKLGDKDIKSTEELTITAAMKKRQELVEAYKKEKTDINPLVLIQIPRRIGNREDELRLEIEKILKSKYSITTEKGNNKLAIWLSEEKINRENVERNDSPVEVLIFKEAIAYGWDCPRAQILVVFREWKSRIFSIQTVGRIMRMPEPDKGHYKNEILNYGYVYTNLDNIEIQEDIAKDYITIYTSKRRFDPKLSLLSRYPKRHREKTRLSPLFQEIFLKQAKEYDLKRQIDIKARKFDLKIISDYKAEDVDALAGAKIVGDKEIKASDFDLQKLFDFFVRNNLTPFYPEDRSVKRVEESIYKFFESDWEKIADKWEEIVQIILSDKNSQHFVNVLGKAKEKYQAEVIKKESEMMDVGNWNIPETLSFGKEYSAVSVEKSIMQPFYNDEKWKSETTFINFLDKSEKVEWWFKNGDRDATFFAIPYDNGEKKPFYVDFIVMLKDGRIGLFDPHGTFLSDFGPKSDGLRQYIQSENKKGKKLFGGIVANTDQRDYRGRWIYFDKPNKDFKDNSFDNWADLIL